MTQTAVLSSVAAIRHSRLRLGERYLPGYMSPAADYSWQHTPLIAEWRLEYQPASYVVWCPRTFSRKVRTWTNSRASRQHSCSVWADVTGELAVLITVWRVSMTYVYSTTYTIKTREITTVACVCPSVRPSVIMKRHRLSLSVWPIMRLTMLRL